MAAEVNKRKERIQKVRQRRRSRNPDKVRTGMRSEGSHHSGTACSVYPSCPQ